MNTPDRISSVALAALAACPFWIASAPASAEEIFYHFDFNDGLVPEALTVTPFDSGATADPRYEIKDGHLRVYDTKPAGWSGLIFSPVASSPDRWRTDTHVSAVFNSDGGVLGGVCGVAARATGLPLEPNASWYECFLIPSPSDPSLCRFGINKAASGDASVAGTQTSSFDLSGPCLLEFDVFDGATPDGREYTDLLAHLTYDDGQQTKSIQLRDWGTLGGYPRIPAGDTSFYFATNSSLGNAGWILDASVDDVTIRATVVPEPNAFILVMLGAALPAWRRRQ